MKRIIIALVSLTAILSMASWRLNQPVHASGNGTLTTTLTVGADASYGNGSTAVTTAEPITLTIVSTAPVNHSGTATFKALDTAGATIWTHTKSVPVITANATTVVTDTWTPTEQYATAEPTDTEGDGIGYTINSYLTDNLPGYSPLSDNATFGFINVARIVDTGTPAIILCPWWVNKPKVVQGITDHGWANGLVNKCYDENNGTQYRFNCACSAWGYKGVTNLFSDAYYISGSGKPTTCTNVISCRFFTHQWAWINGCFYYFGYGDAHVTVGPYGDDDTAYSASLYKCW